MQREIETYLNSLCLSALLHPSVQDALCLEPARLISMRKAMNFDLLGIVGSNGGCGSFSPTVPAMKPWFAHALTRRRRRHPARHWLSLYRLCRSVAVGLPVVSPALVAKDRLGCRGAAGFSAANVLEASRKIPDRGCAQGQIRKGQGIV